MPKALNVDWNLAQALYIQGVQYPAIVEKVRVTESALRQRVSRGKWGELRAEAQRAVSQAVTQTLVEQSSFVRSELGKAVVAQAKAIAAVQDPKPSDLANSPARQGQAAVLKLVSESASNIFDWGKEREVSLIRLDFSAQDLAQQQNQPVIDVVSVPVPSGQS